MMLIDGLMHLAIPESDVDPAERRTAQQELARARADLNLPGLHVKWFRDPTPADVLRRPFEDAAWKFWRMGRYGKELWGLYDPAEPDVLWIKAGMGPRLVAESVHHEAKHAAQHRAGELDDPASFGDAEQAARVHAGKATARGPNVHNPYRWN